MALATGRSWGTQRFQVQVWGKEGPSSHLDSPCEFDLRVPIFPSVKQGTEFPRSPAVGRIKGDKALRGRSALKCYQVS